MMSSSPNTLKLAPLLVPMNFITFQESLLWDPDTVNPSEWLHLNEIYVKGIVGTMRIPDSTFNGIAMYLRVTVYVYLICRMSENSSEATRNIFNDLNVLMEQWRALDEIQNLASHMLTRNSLQNLLERIRTHVNIPSRQGYVDQLFFLDATAIDAQLSTLLQDPFKRKSLFGRKGEEAQQLLNLLQARLDFPLDPLSKRVYVRTIIKLSQASGLYPECMVLENIQMIGEDPVAFGNFADVWKALWSDQIVAVKVLRVHGESDLIQLLKSFSREAVIWRQLNHPNVLPFYGVYHLNKGRARLCLASPWLENGSVVQFLRLNPDANCIPLVADIAQGLDYLHSMTPSIIHGDLKGANILVTPSGRACIADFGLATAKQATTLAVYSTSTNCRGGTTRWMAPELIHLDAGGSGGNSLASDVYAFACVCYEMFSGQLPFHDLRTDAPVIFAVLAGKRPTYPSHDLGRVRGLDEEIWKLIELCWAEKPEERPTAGQIIERLCAPSYHFIDDRPSDTFDYSFPSRVSYEDDHPFSTLSLSERSLERFSHVLPSAGSSEHVSYKPNTQFNKSPESSYTSRNTVVLPTFETPSPFPSDIIRSPPNSRTLDQNRENSTSLHARHSSGMPGLVFAPQTSSTKQQGMGSSLPYEREWNEIPEKCPIAGDLKLFVPQSIFRPYSSDDIRRYNSPLCQEPSRAIIFKVEDPYEWGIDLADALNNRVGRLIDKDECMHIFEESGEKLKVRLQWPGHRMPWSKYIRIKDNHNPPRPVTASSLAKVIARCLDTFIKDTQNEFIDVNDPNALRFRVGTRPNDVKLKDLVLVSLHRVSEGSWQPHIRLNRRV